METKERTWADDAIDAILSARDKCRQGEIESRVEGLRRFSQLGLDIDRVQREWMRLSPDARGAS